MKRRNFIGTSAAALFLSSSLRTAKGFSQVINDNRNILKPKPLKTGSTVGVIAPATSVTDPDDIDKAEEALKFFGLKMILGKNVPRGNGYKTRSVSERIEDLHNMFKNDSVDAVFCIRGGYGAAQILDKVDYKLISQNPKIFLGYSDITALHLAINKYCNMVTFHGPVLLSDFSKFTSDFFHKALFTNEPLGLLTNPDTKNNFREVHPLRTIVPGKARGRIIGGNLSIISNLMGTPFEIETDGAILCIEDVGEEPYAIDRMLTQLRLSKKLEKAAGIIVGECYKCSGNELSPSRIWDYSLGEVLNNILGQLKIPVFYGLTFGHTSDQLTLPFGTIAEMDADAKTLNIIESSLKN